MNIEESLAMLDAEVVELMDEPKSEENREKMREKFRQCNQLLLSSATFHEYGLAEHELDTFQNALKAKYQDYVLYTPMASEQFSKLI